LGDLGVYVKKTLKLFIKINRLWTVLNCLTIRSRGVSCKKANDEQLVCIKAREFLDLNN
jgi:hypothetical protein